MLKQQIPNHELYKINHKMSPSLNNSHKMSLCLNNSHKAHPPVNNNHKVKHPLILNRNLFHHNSAMMMNFQIHMPWPEKLLSRKILDLYQRNQNIVYNRKHITFNPLCLIFSLQIKRKMSYTLEKLTYCNYMPSAPKFFDLPFTKIMYSLKIFLFSFQYQSDAQLTVFLFFQFAFINTFNQLFML